MVFVLFGSVPPPPPHHHSVRILTFALSYSFLLFLSSVSLAELAYPSWREEGREDQNKTTTDCGLLYHKFPLHTAHSRAVLVWSGGNIIPDQHWAELDKDRERGAHAHCLYTRWRHLFVYPPQGKSAKMEQNVTVNLTTLYFFLYPGCYFVTVPTVWKRKA